MAQPVLEIQNLKFAYTLSAIGQEWVVDLPQLRIDPGEQVLITARSGRGKSTLLQLIAGLLDPSQGRVEIVGQSIHALAPAARDRVRAARIGMIFQTFNLLQGFTARENVMAALMFGPTPARTHHERAGMLLKQLGIDRPEAKAEELSVGQQQRVAVARALAGDPALVLADEPTASLDPENAAIAMDLIQTACRERGAALLCVSHDPGMAGRFARRVSLESPGAVAAAVA
ncbi:MAG: ABC transporter ATP-binding protein [Phycisphaerales bacterium]